ncbi:hypothetical protein H2198_006486 [Neophaeococcomyces mojaviensis]|uniref:Uncharacterized protein n=1 Tax=Neophaeococcomyces mojaviensis TaxID=3383035 RepID=A0ACC3A3F0_9EURO|nr:hypothetical protein H2198_006486 [Knufia sp. JES_112]
MPIHREFPNVMTETNSKTAFVTGGNGITGSAIVEYLVNNTKAEEWQRIITTSRSPFKNAVSDPRIEFIALDFTNPPEVLIEKMRDVCNDVTHTYFSSYVHRDDFQELNIANCALFENFLNALTAVAPNLASVTLQTGGKHYGVHLSPVPSPAREEEPRRAATVDNFYYPQEDFLIAKQRGQNWSWNVVRPEAIIGTTMKPNGMNSALTYALYILTCKDSGEEPKMPTNQIYWNGYDDCSYAPLIADLTLFVSTNSGCANQAFNVTNGDYFCWRYMWPRLTAYFGIQTSSEHDFQQTSIKIGDPHLEIALKEWATNEKRKVWDRLCDDMKCPEAKGTWDAGTWQYQDWVFGRTWSATLSMSKARRYGYKGYVDSFEAFVETFEKMKKLKQIPS